MSLQFVISSARVRSLLPVSFIFILLLGGAACRRAGESSTNAANGNANSTASTDNTSKTPPFSTKEPERYQATMIISGSLGANAQSIPGLPGTLSRQLNIARDGDRRRIDYELIPGSKVTDLQTSAGHFMLLHPKKLYAEIKPGEGGGLADATRNLPSDFSPDRLLNESSPGANFEKIGTEQINGRQTTKYRVTTTGQTGEARSVTTETIVWVDESLGMPIKSETTSTGEQARGSKVTMELKDIKQEVDQSLFELPKDYKRVSNEELTRQMIPSLGNILGGDGEENRRGK